MLNIDKKSAEVFTSASENITMSLAGRGVTLANAASKASKVSLRSGTYGTAKAFSIDEVGSKSMDGKGIALYTADGWAKLKANVSYVHLKTSKRFVTYRVTSVSSDKTTIQLRKVKCIQDYEVEVTKEETIADLKTLPKSKLVEMLASKL